MYMYMYMYMYTAHFTPGPKGPPACDVVHMQGFIERIVSRDQTWSSI